MLKLSWISRTLPSPPYSIPLLVPAVSQDTDVLFVPVASLLLLHVQSPDYPVVFLEDLVEEEENMASEPYSMGIWHLNHIQRRQFAV